MNRPRGRASRARVDEAGQASEPFDVHRHGALKSLALGGRAELYAMDEAQLLRDLPEEGPDVGGRHEFDDPRVRLAEQQIGQTRAVRADDELGALEQED